MHAYVGWQPLVSIQPVDAVFNPTRPLVLSCSDPFIPPSVDHPTPPTISYVWSILMVESQLAPLLGVFSAGSDPCTLQLPPHSLRTGTRYQFRLDAFLPSGVSSRAAVVLQTVDQPLGGQLRVHPLSGISVSTEFTLSCYYWTAGRCC